MNSNIQPTQDNCVMTLKQIVDFINQKRGVKKGDKGFKQHSKAILTIDLLIAEAPNFGGRKIVSLENNGVKYTTLCFTAKQAIAVGAKLDNGLLMDVIDKVEELEGKNQKPQLSFNQHKMQMISDVAQKAIDSINALEDDTKQIEAPIVIEEAKKVSTRSTVSHNTESKYYKLSRTNLRDLPLEDPIEGLLCFEYYNDTDCILYSVKKNKTYKIWTPPWAKELGTWSFLKAHVKFIRTPKTGKFALISIKEKR